MLLESLRREKDYKEETLYLATSLVDRFLSALRTADRNYPNLIMIAVIATLMAAKMEQPIQPSMIRMIRLVESNWGVGIDQKDLIDLESDIIKTLDFNLIHTAPTVFIERYMRLMDLDKKYPELLTFAKKSARSLLRSHLFLKYNSAQIGAAALTFAFNVASNQ